jgi:tRNA-dihydrouridine synthase B
MKKARRKGAVAGGNGSYTREGRQQGPRGTIFASVQVDLRESWWIGEVEVPTRLVLAPMAGVSVQAFRRQGRRYGAGLVCSEMVSCAGLEHRNERTLGYLRVGRDEHPLAIQIFGSEPAVMAEAARMVVAAGADIVDINFGCPVRKVTKTGAGATLLDDPDRACAIVDAVASTVDVPVSVKMRRGLEDGSRACLVVGPQLVAAGAATLTLHPRSARQMYTGEADHSLTAELVELVDVPVIASGDITSRARAQSVLAMTSAAAVMVGRGAQGNPWALREIVDGDAEEPSREEVAAELILFIRETVRELGEHRAGGFLKKFYGWYLGRGRFPKPFKQEIVQLATTDEVVTRLFAAAPGAAEIVERLVCELPHTADEILLVSMPISIYGGGELEPMASCRGARSHRRGVRHPRRSVT